MIVKGDFDLGDLAAEPSTLMVNHAAKRLVRTFPAAITPREAVAFIDEALAMGRKLATSGVTTSTIGLGIHLAAYNRAHARLTELRKLWAGKVARGDRNRYTNADRSNLLAALKRFVVDAAPFDTRGDAQVVYKEARADLVKHVTRPWTNPESPFNPGGPNALPWYVWAGGALAALAILRPYVAPLTRRL
jgi:hypothetical protein